MVTRKKGFPFSIYRAIINYIYKALWYKHLYFDLAFNNVVYTKEAKTLKQAETVRKIIFSSFSKLKRVNKVNLKTGKYSTPKTIYFINN